MALSVEPTIAVDVAFEHWPVTLLVAVTLWVALRELEPVHRLRRRLQ